jgi:integrase
MLGSQKIKLPPRVNGFFDKRLGRWRHMLRLPGQKAVTLPGLPWSPLMMAAIEAAIEGRVIPSATAVAIGAARTKPGTLNEAIVRFYDHEVFLNSGKAQQVRHRQKLEWLRQQELATGGTLGDNHLVGLTHTRLAKIINDIPGAHAQRHLLNALRSLMRFAKLANLIEVDPTVGLKGKRLQKTGGYKRADEDEIAQYQSHHALGTMARLALEIMLNTGLRRSDAVLLGRQHVRDGVITIKPQKTSNVTGVVVTIPVHSDLRAALDAMPPRQAKPGETTPLTFLQTGAGKPYSVAGFGNWFRDQCVAAGVEFRAHGLRKAICIRLVRQGMTPHQVAAITGHEDLREIELYAKEFDREHAAKQAMASLEKRKAVASKA